MLLVILVYLLRISLKILLFIPILRIYRSLVETRTILINWPYITKFGRVTDAIPRRA